MRIKMKKPDIEKRVDKILSGERTEIKWWETLSALIEEIEDDEHYKEVIEFYREDENETVEFGYKEAKIALEQGFEIR